MTTTTDLHAEFLFDFGSPNAYLCHKVMPAITARSGVRFSYTPILLGGLFKLSNNRSPIEAYAGIPNKMAYERLEMRRFVVRHGLKDFKFNPHFPVNTLQIMRGAIGAKQLGCFDAYADAMFSAMWEKGMKMDDPAAIASVLIEAGLDADRLMQTAQEPEVKAQLVANTQAAHDRGAFGAPTFYVGDQLFFGKEHLRTVEEMLARRPAGAAAG